MSQANDATLSRRARIYDYIIDHHPDSFRREGSQIRIIDTNVTLSPAQPCCAYCWDGNYVNNYGKPSLNAIDVLTQIYGYSYRDAANALIPYRVAFDFSPTHAKSNTDNITANVKNIATGKPIPEPIDKPYKRVYAYLTKTRGIFESIVTDLIRRNILFEDENGNAVFANRDRTYAEIRSTVSYATNNTHRTARPTAKTDVFWHYLPHKVTADTVAYICEAAIDAISLYQLLPANQAKLGLYCSVGGVNAFDRIDAVIEACRKRNITVILAVDNDSAGDKCAAKYANLQRIVPLRKDWNADLCYNTDKK